MDRRQRAAAPPRRTGRGLAVAAFAALAGCALAGCAGNGAGSAVQPVAAGAVSGPTLDWRTRLSGEDVYVTLTDPRRYWRVERVELVSPGGRAVAADELTRERYSESGYTSYGYGGYGGTSVGIGGGFGSRGGGGVGIGLSVPLFGAGTAAPPPPDRVDARIRLSDAETYRRTAAAWKLRVTLTDPQGQTSHAEFPAPVPPG